MTIQGTNTEPTYNKIWVHKLGDDIREYIYAELNGESLTPSNSDVLFVLFDQFQRDVILELDWDDIEIKNDFLEIYISREQTSELNRGSLEWMLKVRSKETGDEVTLETGYLLLERSITGLDLNSET